MEIPSFAMWLMLLSSAVVEAAALRQHDLAHRVGPFSAKIWAEQISRPDATGTFPTRGVNVSQPYLAEKVSWAWTINVKSDIPLKLADSNDGFAYDQSKYVTGTTIALKTPEDLLPHESWGLCAIFFTDVSPYTSRKLQDDDGSCMAGLNEQCIREVEDIAMSLNKEGGCQCPDLSSSCVAREGFGSKLRCNRMMIPKDDRQSRASSAKRLSRRQVWTGPGGLFPEQRDWGGFGAPPKEWCDEHPTHKDCVWWMDGPPTKEWCDEHPKDPACQQLVPTTGDTVLVEDGEESPPVVDVPPTGDVLVGDNEKVPPVVEDPLPTTGEITVGDAESKLCPRAPHWRDHCPTRFCTWTNPGGDFFVPDTQDKKVMQRSIHARRVPSLQKGTLKLVQLDSKGIASLEDNALVIAIEPPHKKGDDAPLKAAMQRVWPVILSWTYSGGTDISEEVPRAQMSCLRANMKTVPSSWKAEVTDSELKS